MQQSNGTVEDSEEKKKQASAKRGPAPVWTAGNCAQALDQFIETYKRHPRPSECNAEHNLPSRRTIEKLLGMSALEYYCREARKKGYDLSDLRRGAARSQPHTKTYTTESIHEALQEFVEREGRVPATTELGKNGLPYGFTIKRVTGITARKLMQQWFPEYTIMKLERICWTAERIRDAMDKFVERYGRPPMTSELNRAYDLPTPQSIERRFGLPAIEFIRERYPEYLCEFEMDSKEMDTQEENGESFSMTMGGM